MNETEHACYQSLSDCSNANNSTSNNNQNNRGLFQNCWFYFLTTIGLFICFLRSTFASSMDATAAAAAVGGGSQQPSLGGYRYSSVFEFEKNFNDVEATHWMKKNWQKSFVYSGIYLVVIFGGQHLMKDRPRLELRPLLTVWNTILAVFSIMGALRSWPEFLYLITTHGFYHTVCISTMYKGVSGFWTYLFVMSKLIELGDTLFIILRKQQLIFLHWYHHITVLCYVWYSYMDHTAPGQWFLVMNYTVHALMYTYYAFRSMKFKISKWVMMTITTLQLVQMVIGCFIAVYTHVQMQNGVFCNQTQENVIFCMLIYFSYFILFAHFFYNTYFGRKQIHNQSNISVTNKRLSPSSNTETSSGGCQTKPKPDHGIHEKKEQ